MANARRKLNGPVSAKQSAAQKKQKVREQDHVAGTSKKTAASVVDKNAIASPTSAISVTSVTASSATMSSTTAKSAKPAKPVNLSALLKSYKDTSQIPIAPVIVEQVVGQDEAVKVIKKAALQRRHILLIGEPGTGKSMIGIALAELLPKEKLVDTMSFPNPNDENQPLIRNVPAGKGRDIVMEARLESTNVFKNKNILFIIFAIIVSLIPYYFWKTGEISDVIYAASMITSMIFIIGVIMMVSVSKKMNGRISVPKVIVDNYHKEHAPFMDATGAHAGALLGDVLHDPFQSGGLGTPAHERVVAGMIHKTHKGVLFIDEIATLQGTTQQELLSAIQEKKYAITGQSERSAGAMVRTEAVPCDFILVAAGNYDTIKNMHPALRSRIRGYGYEVYMNETMKDTVDNRNKLIQFVAQEVKKDGKIPHFSRAAVEQIITEARKRANRKNHLTLRLRELGGLVRAAGDLAHNEGSKLVQVEHVIAGRRLARTLEQQIADKYIEHKKEYDIIITTGQIVGRVNGLAVIGGGSAYSGIVLPIEAQVTPGGKKLDFIATGKLGEIAKEAITNVSAIVKKFFGEDIHEKYDVFVQFLQTHEGVEGDSASIAVATAIISALKNVPVKQTVAMTGSLSVRGEVLPVGGVSSKIEAAIEAGIPTVIVPKSNVADIVIDAEQLKKVKIVPVVTINEVLRHALDWTHHEAVLKTINKR